jgi:uncharacterized membrane protein YeaQ/YmgE (transglycosylase-associated protein family)
MQVLIGIFVGWIASWLAGKGHQGKRAGLPLHLGTGVAGAVIGGSPTRSVGFSGYAGTLLATFMALCVAPRG